MGIFSPNIPPTLFDYEETRNYTFDNILYPTVIVLFQKFRYGKLGGCSICIAD